MIFLLSFLFITATIFLGLFILIQQSKGDMGLGALQSTNQMLFGGSGGQDVFEKITWVLAAIFMLGALTLGITKSKYSVSQLSSYRAPVKMQDKKVQVATQEVSEEE